MKVASVSAPLNHVCIAHTCIAANSDWILKCLYHQNGFLLIRIEQKKWFKKFFFRFCHKILVLELYNSSNIEIFRFFEKKKLSTLITGKEHGN